MRKIIPGGLQNSLQIANCLARLLSNFPLDKLACCRVNVTLAGAKYELTGARGLRVRPVPRGTFEVDMMSRFMRTFFSQNW